MDDQSQFESTIAEAFVALRLKRPNLDKLSRAYLGENRHYHNLRHVLSCLNMLSAVEPSTSRLTVALAYHDSVYDPRSSTNEYDSAIWLRDDLIRTHAPNTLVKELMDLVQVTDHKSDPETEEQEIIVDVDLAILGPRPDVYQTYAKQIRREYDWVMDADFRRGRGKLFRHFLDRPYIYRTALFRERWEARARINLDSELRSLSLASE